MDELSDRQRKILEHIRRTVADRGYPPSVREIGEAVGLHSPSSVHAQLAGLAEKGYLAKDPSRPRAIRVRTPEAAAGAGASDERGARTPGGSARVPGGSAVARVREVPVLGSIAAGAPLLAEQNIEDTLVVPEDLTGKGTLFALRVRGESMTGAGILDRDTVIVRQQPDADDGEIVAALIEEEEATVKRLSRKGTRTRLLAENPAYGPIETDRARILGKVVAVLRRVP